LACQRWRFSTGPVGCGLPAKDTTVVKPVSAGDWCSCERGCSSPLAQPDRLSQALKLPNKLDGLADFLEEISSMKLRYLYLAFCLLGLVLPYSQFVPWIMEHHGLNMPLFIRDLFANRISAFFAVDVVVSAVVLISFVQGRRKAFGNARPLVTDRRRLIGGRFAWIAALPLSATTPARS